MEGAFRPGHFDGVAAVVKRFFDIILPDNAYFGEKDYQQLLIIKDVKRQFNLKTNIIACPIQRQDDGVAMSSRNMRLSPEEKAVAPFIYQTLLQARRKSSSMNSEELESWVVKRFETQPLMRLEYFSIADSHTLMPLEKNAPLKGSIACIAIYLGNIRLIDNIVF